MCNYIPQGLFNQSPETAESHLGAIADGVEEDLKNQGVFVDCRKLAFNDTMCLRMAEQLVTRGSWDISNKIRSRITGSGWSSFIREGLLVG